MAIIPITLNPYKSCGFVFVAMLGSMSANAGMGFTTLALVAADTVASRLSRHFLLILDNRANCALGYVIVRSSMIAENTPSSPAVTAQPNFVTRWRDHADVALARARHALDDTEAGASLVATRLTDIAKTATDTYLVLEGRPTEVVQHIHTVDLEGIGLKLQAALARVMQGAKVVPARPAAIDATFVPLDLGGPMGRHHDVGTSSGVPSPPSAGLQHDAPRRPRPEVRKVYPTKPGNHGPAALDPANPLKKARLRLNRRAARLANAAEKEAKRAGLPA